MHPDVLPWCLLCIHGGPPLVSSTSILKLHIIPMCYWCCLLTCSLILSGFLNPIRVWSPGKLNNEVSLFFSEKDQSQASFFSGWCSYEKEKVTCWSDIILSTRILDKSENKCQKSKHWIEVLTNLRAENRNKKTCLMIIEYSLLIIIYFTPDKELWSLSVDLAMRLL